MFGVRYARAYGLTRTCSRWNCFLTTCVSFTDVPLRKGIDLAICSPLRHWSTAALKLAGYFKESAKIKCRIRLIKLH